MIKAVAAYNSNHPKNSCVGYVLEFDGIKLYHAGDTGFIIEMADLANQKITYALLPMDGIYTMSPEVATQAAASIQAAYNIPIHTMPPPDTYSDAIVARFTPQSKSIVKPGVTITLNPASTSVEPSESQIKQFRLQQNYPNPFNPSTQISFTISSSSFVSLKVYDVRGREISTLVADFLLPGIYSTRWNATTVPSGVYFYSLRAGKYSDTKKLVLLK
jgi:hypothetical protein